MVNKTMNEDRVNKEFKAIRTSHNRGVNSTDLILIKTPHVILYESDSSFPLFHEPVQIQMHIELRHS